ncbi:MAG: hypothetical protein KA933_12980 [Flavobacterium sp.]|nr:hypothetical protein [Flavobacterium sp.]
MIWLDNEGHIVMRSNYNYQSAENIIDYQKAIIHLLQSQNKDSVNEETTYNALELLETMLFEPSQLNIENAMKEKIQQEFVKQE